MQAEGPHVRGEGPCASGESSGFRERVFMAYLGQAENPVHPSQCPLWSGRWEGLGGRDAVACYPPLSATPAGSGLADSGERASFGLCGCEETLHTRPRHKERCGDPSGISPLQRCVSRRSGKMRPKLGRAANADGSHMLLSSGLCRNGGCGSCGTAHFRDTQKCP